MFFFDQRKPCTFRGISVYLGFATPEIGVRGPSASVMDAGVAGNTVSVRRCVLGHQASPRAGVMVAGSPSPTRQRMSNTTGGGAGGFWRKVEISMDFLNCLFGIHFVHAVSVHDTAPHTGASIIFQISPPLMKRFSKFRMLRAGKFMLPPFLEHQ